MSCQLLGHTCVDELDVPLQVPVDHEHLVAAWVRAGPLPHLLVVLLDVFLQGKDRARDREQLGSPNTKTTMCKSRICTPVCKGFRWTQWSLFQRLLWPFLQDRRNRESQSRLEKARTPSRLLLVAHCPLQPGVGN